MDDPEASPRVHRENSTGLAFEDLAEWVDEVRARVDQGYAPGLVIGKVTFRAGLTSIEMTLSRGTGAR